MITPEEFEASMKAIFECPFQCKEEAHIQADGLMCDVLTQLGYEAGIEVFMAAEKWYS